MTVLLETLETLTQRKQAIRFNVDLSDEGKRKELAKLSQQEAQFRQSAHNELTMSWGVMRTKFDRLATSKAEAQEQAAKAWDFDRLLYNARAIESEVKQAASLADIRRKYEDVLKSGDKHARRAWAENIHAEASKHFHNAPASEITDLKHAAKKDLATLTTTPELESLAKQENDLTQQAVQLHKETQVIARHFSVDNWTGQGNEFYKLIDGVRVAESVDPATLATSHNVVLNP